MKKPRTTPCAGCGKIYSCKCSGDLNTLTERQKQILDLWCYGHTAKRIAVTLGLSRSTVTNTMSQVYKKLKVANRRELNAFIGEKTK